MQTIPEVKELIKKLEKLGSWSGGFSGQYVDVAKNIRDKTVHLTLDLQMYITAINYEKLLKFLDGL